MNNFLKIVLKSVLVLHVLFFAYLKNIHSQINQLSWTTISEQSFISKGERMIIPVRYLIFRTSFDQLRTTLIKAPFEFTEAAQNFPYIIELPLPTGGLSKFFLTEYSMMEAPLAAQFPEIKTYNIKGIDDPYATGKLDVTGGGFHAMVLTPLGDYFIDPYSSSENEIYITYFKSDLLNKNVFECLSMGHVTEHIINNSNMSTGEQLRTYRLAVGATGEYTGFHGGTVTAGMNAIITAINRVNGVFERDMSVRMTLVANNNLIVYTNPATDPYSNTNGGAMLSQNQTTLDAIIGSSNYDIGHVFSTGGGGVAYLGVVCINGFKAGGVTGLPTPIGDPFYIDYVAHEIGHQYNGNHSFNGSSCASRNAPTAWEPGSGSTIMGYAGICGPDNLQNNSDAYFHTGNVSEITNYTQSGSGSICPQITLTGNTPPTVTVPSGGFTIPINTPFQLTGSASDLQTPGSLTYCWEEFDTGPAGAPNSPSGNAPIFRSFTPVITPTRIFPKISNLLNNTQTIGEILPSYTRSLNFRFVVRDNSVGGGGINFGSIQFNVNSAAGPFLVTQPNTNVTWTSNTQMITWNVANTTAIPVNCSMVNIKLSSDGGLTFPTSLSANTANDGTQIVSVPAVITNQARIRVEAVGNIFFDISNTNFSIQLNPVPANITIAPEGFYNSSSNSLNIRDTVRVYLRNISSPFIAVDSGKMVLDSLNLTGQVLFNNAPSGVYYIQIRHRNTLETWSKSGGETYVRGGVMNYDFTSAQSQAFGNNLKQVDNSPLRFAIYSGDVSQDGIVDAGDLSLVDNDAFTAVSGYVKTDVNGDNFVDASDLSIVDNNAFNGVLVIRP